MKELMVVERLEKSFKDKKAVDKISFKVNEGEILCFLGPNGAGKSTTINILSTAMKCDEGRICFEGIEIKRGDNHYKSSLGIVPQDLAVYEELTAEQNIKFFGALYGLKGEKLSRKVAEALNFVGLYDRKNDKVKTFSGGMKRRLNIACAIAHEPKLIIMDEPTVGIDPQSRNHILSSIRDLRAKGSTIIYTTHYMEEVEEISTRIMIVDHGKIIAEGTKEELKDKYADEKMIEIEIDHHEDFNANNLFIIDGVKSVDIVENKVKINVLKGIENLDRIIGILINQNILIKNITTVSASLEMVFLKLTGRNLRD